MAIRMPISRVLRVTLYAITPYRPNIASSVASIENAIESCRTMRSVFRLLPTCSSNVLRPSSGRSGSSVLMTRRTCGIICSGASAVRT